MKQRMRVLQDKRVSCFIVQVLMSLTTRFNGMIYQRRQNVHQFRGISAWRNTNILIFIAFIPLCVQFKVTLIFLSWRD